MTRGGAGARARVRVRVPASTANLGPGFDVLGMALDLCLDVGVGVDGPVAPADEGHPAVVAFRRLGGEGPLWCRSPIPMGRGLGFSGAARVAGLLAATAVRSGVDDGRSFDRHDVDDEVLALATELEGHADNVAASLHGGVVAVAAGRCVSVPLALDPAVVMWVPSARTSTDESRGRLADTVSLADAVFNIGRTALLVAAFARGDVESLRVATEDRLHQDVRFRAAPDSRRALDAALDAGAWCGWLSGSGPSIAALAARSDAEKVAAALPAEGQVKVLAIHEAGAAFV